MIVDNYTHNNIADEKISNIKNETTIARIIIDKINMDLNIYKISNQQEDVDKNIIILKNSTFPDQKESILFIAGHSGTGENAFFNSIDTLNKNDIVKIIYKNKLYTYYVKNIFEEEKSGYIHITKSSKHQLILTTCSKNKDKQFIVSCTLKE